MFAINVVISVLITALAVFFSVLNDNGDMPSPENTCTKILIDITVSLSIHAPDSVTNDNSGISWQRVDKDLYLHSDKGATAWLFYQEVERDELNEDSIIIADIRVSKTTPDHDETYGPWESRPGAIWLRRIPLSQAIKDELSPVTSINVLFGEDAVDPRPGWDLLRPALHLEAMNKTIPQPYLTARHGESQPIREKPELRFKKDGKFKMMQISDMHMITGVGSCNDSMDEHGAPLPESEADPRTVRFMDHILDVENPDFVILTGDQLHHDILDSQTALFKAVAPLIRRSVPWAAVFGNHDDEGRYALNRADQMSIMQDLPFSLCEAGPSEPNGVGNYYINVFPSTGNSEVSPLATLFLLDSHGILSSKVPFLGYQWISQSQIKWFSETSQSLRKERDAKTKATSKEDNPHHLSLAFQHIPLLEFSADSYLTVVGGARGEPTEGPKYNSHFYDTLVKEEVVALGSGHDHVNDFCAMRRTKKPVNEHYGPWLCYGGGAGFGGYCKYGEKRFYRRSRIWEFDESSGSLRTWKRLEYDDPKARTDEVLLCEQGKVVLPSKD